MTSPCFVAEALAHINAAVMVIKATAWQTELAIPIYVRLHSVVIINLEAQMSHKAVGQTICSHLENGRCLIRHFFHLSDHPQLLQSSSNSCTIKKCLRWLKSNINAYYVNGSLVLHVMLSVRFPYSSTWVHQNKEGSSRIYCSALSETLTPLGNFQYSTATDVPWKRKTRLLFTIFQKNS